MHNKLIKISFDVAFKSDKLFNRYYIKKNNQLLIIDKQAEKYFLNDEEIKICEFVKNFA